MKLKGEIKFPKCLFSLKEVKQERKRMEFPKAWKLQRDTDNYILYCKGNNKGGIKRLFV